MFSDQGRLLFQGPCWEGSRCSQYLQGQRCPQKQAGGIEGNGNGLLRYTWESSEGRKWQNLPALCKALFSSREDLFNWRSSSSLQPHSTPSTSG